MKNVISISDAAVFPSSMEMLVSEDAVWPRAMIKSSVLIGCINDVWWSGEEGLLNATEQTFNTAMVSACDEQKADM